jgi:hypothetical protein
LFGSQRSAIGQVDSSGQELTFSLATFSTGTDTNVISIDVK